MSIADADNIVKVEIHFQISNTVKESEDRNFSSDDIQFCKETYVF